VKDKSTIVADEAIRAVHDLGFEAGRPAVAARIDDLGSREWSVFMLRRLTHSAFRLGGEKNAARVVAIAANEKLPDEARAEANRHDEVAIEEQPRPPLHPLRRAVRNLFY
jgi:hypothetical protein